MLAFSWQINAQCWIDEAQLRSWKVDVRQAVAFVECLSRNKEKCRVSERDALKILQRIESSFRHKIQVITIGKVNVSKLREVLCSELESWKWFRNTLPEQLTIYVADWIVAKFEGFDIFQTANGFWNRLEIVPTQVNSFESFEISCIEIAY